ncbi:MAG: LysM peptidoglycan-binding domain-containing protein [Actinobacteria bacterium]|nr:LysM peptidoglycan-binding domain-containing protein [Actinomycetota bacterium]
MLRRLVVGVGSLVGLLFLLAGVPALLLTVGANPARAGITSWSDLWVRLSMPDNGGLFALVLTIAAWIAWAYLAVAILIELTAMVRRLPVPRIRGLSLGQSIARPLVAGVVLLFVASPMLAATASPAHADPITPPHGPTATTTQKAPAKAPEKAYKTVTVERGDSLSRIAKERLGNGHNWGGIFDASKGIEQPGGRHLTDPDEIDVGWTLRVPVKHHKTHQDQQNQPDAISSAGQPDATPASGEPQVAVPAAESPATVGSTSTAPATQTTTSASSVPDAMRAPATETESDPVPLWAPAAGVGTVVAAGVISLVAYRRRRRMRSWRPGLQVPMPPAPTSATEQELRAAAAPLSLDIVDHALRTLSANLADANTALPQVHAARLSPAAFELFLTEPAHLPAPWRGTADATVWLLEGVDAAELPDEDLSEIPAPYPALVTIGADAEQSNVLLDLEYLGSLGVLGDTETTREALSALAIELAVSPWADDLTVTVVGAFAELEGSLQTGRVRYVPTVELLLTELQQRTTADQQALTAAGAGTVGQARSSRTAPSTWSPEIVIIPGELTDRQRNLLANLVDALPRVAIAAVTGATAPIGEWTLQLHDDRTATLNPVGLTLTPQLVTAAAYSSLLHLVEIATYDDLIAATRDDPEDAPQAAERPQEPPTAPDAANDQPETGSAPQIAAQASVPATIITTASPDIRLVTAPPVSPQPDVAEAEESSGPTIRVLGPVELDRADGPVEPTKRARLMEYATYLLLHPTATAADIDDAIWPSRAKDDNTTTRNTMNSKLRRWLGHDEQGTPYLPLNSYTLAGVTSDWGRWRQLLPKGAGRAPSANLVEAIKLVRGRPFSGSHPHRYGWSEPARQEMTTEIIEACYELARRRLMESDWRGVEAAVVIALSIEPALEHLWRLRILAAHHAGDTTAVDEAKARLLALTDELGLELEPETEQLLQDLTDNPQRAWEKAIAQ